MRRIYLVFILLIFLVTAFGQPAKQFTFTHLSSFNGLSSNFTNYITQDRNGYIWLASLDGLQRYDGHKFLTFRNEPQNGRQLPADIILKIVEDKDGRLWLWGGNKVGIFNTSNFTYTDVEIEGNSIENPYAVFFLEKDLDGNAILFIDKKGLFRYDNGSKKFKLVNEIVLPHDIHFLSYVIMPNLPYIFFSSYDGMYIYNFKTGNLNYEGHNVDNNPLVPKLNQLKYVLALYTIEGDTLWYSTWDLKERGAPHIKNVNLKTGEQHAYSVGMMFGQGYTEIAGCMRQKNGKLWFWGQSFVIEYTGNKGDKDRPFSILSNVYKDEQSIKFDKARHMFEDREHNIWISTDNGVFVFNPDAQQFSNYNMIRPDGSGSIDGPSIFALKLKDNRIIVGSWGSGLYFYDSSFNAIPLPSSMKQFSDPYSAWCGLQHSQTGLVWIGFQGGTIVVYDPVKDKRELIIPDETRSNTIRQCVEDREGNVWLGLQGGELVKWDRKASGGDYKKGYITVRKRVGGFINKLFIDNNGYLWAATEGRGFLKYDPATNKELFAYTTTAPAGQKSWSNYANDILQYDDTTLIVAGGALNVVNTRTNQVHFITIENGLPSNTVYCFKKDKKGLLWLGMAHGLAQFNMQKGIFTFYDRRDGLRFDNFNQGGATTFDDGRMIFLTDHSFMSVDHDKITSTPKPPDAVITDFKLGNRSLPVDSLKNLTGISLDYANTAITIEFSALNYLSQNKIHYFYMLEGIDKDWQEESEGNHAVYSHLPSGRFVFKLKTENTDGVGSDNITTMVIKVQPPFWKTWWFLGLIIFAVIGLFFWLDKQRMQKIRATESVRSRIAGSLTEDMSNSLSSINISSELAKTKVDKDPERTKEYINQISDTSNRMIQSMYDMVWSINPRNDTMQHTIDRMKSFAAEIESMYNLDIVFDIGKEVTHLELDMEYRYELLSIFKEALDNAGRHAQARHIHINIQYQKPKLIMLIEDDGKGFDADAAALKRGISDMRRRAAGINASFYIESNINTGTMIKCIIDV